jgi:hypothetical protein
MPMRLSAAEMADYRRGRDEFIAALGLRALIVEPGNGHLAVVEPAAPAEGQPS